MEAEKWLSGVLLRAGRSRRQNRCWGASRGGDELEMCVTSGGTCLQGGTAEGKRSGI